MEAKFLNFGERRLPSYLGYGILNENSVKFVDDVITADYLLECDGSVVHKVQWNAQFSEIDTILHGKSCTLSHYPTLQYTLMSELQFNDFVQDRVFKFLMQTITSMGNIYVQFPGSGQNKRRAVFYPAGLLMCFRLPVNGKTPALQSFLDKVRATDYISLYEEKKCTLFLSDAAFNITRQPVTVLDFIVPLAFMTSAARLFAESGIIDPRMPYRLMVVESLQAQTSSLQIFTGNKNFPVFGYCYAEISADHLSALKEAFAESVELMKARIN